MLQVMRLWHNLKDEGLIDLNDPDWFGPIRLWSVCGWQLVYSLTWPESDWWDWAGWGCTPVVQSNHDTQDKPAVTTHTQERDTVMAARYICSANTILPSPINAFFNQYLPMSCLVEPQQKQSVVNSPLLHWRVVTPLLLKLTRWFCVKQTILRVRLVVDTTRPTVLHTYSSGWWPNRRSHSWVTYNLMVWTLPGPKHGVMESLSHIYV